ncbi:MAG: glycerol-3-phosphate dehydrogenase/oxidase [Promethearchaeota archaeon]|nr:MAG: glycerol-3-phosphate dehydrogenase/oxidase [Candidatus Lokiarchaeota archaeon]
MIDLEKKLFDQNWNYKKRDNIIRRLKETHYDIIIIGAGITGAGVAREAAMRGLKLAVVDMQDFAAGTSSRSSKLAHGGIRYLSHGEMDLVHESTTERNWLLAHAPTVRPVPFLFVHLKDGKYNKRTIMSAVKIYDFLGNKDTEFKIFKEYKWYKPEEVFELEPEYIREGNMGGAVYYDNNVDDARLTIETLKEAVIRGADVINYCKVNGYVKDNGKIIGIKCRDLENDNDFEIMGTLVINATGIWTDNLLESYPEEIPKPLIRPTKGVHLQYRREHVKNRMATIIRSITDDRAFFVLPRNKDFTIIGTTDTDYKEDLATPFCNKDDADYLIKSTKHYFPSAELDYDNIVSTYAGVRPLVMQKGKSESDISRKHIVFFSDDGLLTMTGGKLTAFRNMAEDLFIHIEEKNIFPDIKRKKNFSKQKYIISLEKDAWIKELKNSGVDIDEDIADHLYQQYGKGAVKILELIKGDNSLKERIIEENDFINAEIIYCLRYELTPHLIDVFCRRTEMSLWISHKKAPEAAKKVAEIIAKEYSWSEEKKNKEIETYIEDVKKTVSFIK